MATNQEDLLELALAGDDEAMALLVRMQIDLEGVTPAEGIQRVLRAWSADGLDGVKKLIAQGLAPAAVLSLFLGEEG